MLDYTVMKPEGILVLKPHAPLAKEDFTGLATVVNAYLADHDKLHGVLIESKEFPGWEDFAGFKAHMNFVRDNHKKVEKIAVVTDSSVAPVAEALGHTFTSAEVKRFAYGEDEQALEWLTGATQAH